MAFLLTYPRERVPLDLQHQLMALQPTFFCPCRVLVATPLTMVAQRIIQASTDLIMTSQFGLKVYVQSWATLNETATIHVLSHKAAAYLKTRVHNPIQIAARESQQGLLAQLSELDIGRTRCWLLGNLAHTPAAFQQDATFVIYQSQWSTADCERVARSLSSADITEALITSPSNFSGLQRVQQLLPRATFAATTYYVLGPTSASPIQRAGLPVVLPDQQVDVLRQMIQKMCTTATG